MVVRATYDLGLLLGREVGIRVGRHVDGVVLMAAIRIAGCLFLVAAHVDEVAVKRLLGS